MNLARTVLVVFLITGTTLAAADKLPRETQLEIIADYLYITGQLDDEAMQSLGIQDMSEREWPVKCGMPAAAAFFLNRDRLDQRLLQSMSASVAARPVLSDSVESDGGNFWIHYTTTGDDAVYEAGIDTVGGGNGVPDYVDKVAEICDSVFWYTIDTLGYPKPPVDTAALSGGDEKYDIYLVNLPQRVYGFTFPEIALDSTTAISYIELDNDYQNLGYDQNPLDAVRVTAAHEYFHAVHFGLDWSEYEQDPGKPQRLYWMEMSATWMEEEQYDDINDYYSYLKYFFSNPSASLQRVNVDGDLHQYGSVVFPIFLTEKYDRNLIREIWLLCRDLGAGPSFLKAADSAIVMASSRDDTANGLPWARHFAEFALWNYFTGSRDSLAPPGIGYSERSNWPPLATIQENKILTLESYPQSIPSTDNYLRPFHNAAEYIEFRNLITLEYDTTYWNCDSTVAVDSCVDSTQVNDTLLGYDFRHIDSTLPVEVDLDRNFLHPWGMSVVYYPRGYPDSVIVEGRLLDCCFPSVVEIVDPLQYEKVAIILSPAFDQYQLFDLNNPMRLGIFANLTGLTVPAADQYEIDILPYPNPAIVKEMAGDLTFRVRLEAGQLSSFPYFTDAYMTVDIYNTAGDLVSTLADGFPRPPIEEYFEFEIGWDMKNRSGRDVASGVYIAFVRLQSAQSKGVLLAEDKVKLLLVR